MAQTSTGLIPSKEDECTLNIYVSKVDCSPSRKLSKQLSAENTTFDTAKFAKGGYTLLEVKYTSPERVSGFQFEIDIPEHHSRIAAVGTKIGTSGEEKSETYDKKFLVFQAKNKVIGIINPDISGSVNGVDYNLTALSEEEHSPEDRTLCYVLLQKMKSFVPGTLCPEAIKIKNIKACRNITTSNRPYTSNKFGVAVTTEPKANWKGSTRGDSLSDIYFASKLFATNTYNRDLDANNDGAIDIVDIVALANKKHNLYWNGASDFYFTDKIVPELICKDHEDFVTKSDLSAELEIIELEVLPNSDNQELYDLSVVFGLRTSNSVSGMQFDFGQDMFGSAIRRDVASQTVETLSFLGPLKELEETWNFKFETIRHRFNKDKITRFLVWQGPIDANKSNIKYDLTTAEQILVINSLEPQAKLTPVLKYTITNQDLNNAPLPEIQYYYADELGENVQEKEEVLGSKRKGDRYYGPVNIIDHVYYTGEIYNPRYSRQLTAKWREFEMLNERILTNDYLNYFEHIDQKLQYSGFDLVYNPDQNRLRDHFENDFEAYLQYLINYLYVPLRNGLDTPVSKYNIEPSSSGNPTHNGYISDCNLDGTKDISDTVSFVNIATQKLSTIETSTVNILKQLSQNESQLSFNNVINSSNPASISEIADNKAIRSNLKSLSKIVPTYLLNNFHTTTLPHHVPSIRTQNTDGAILSFSQRVDVSGSEDIYFKGKWGRTEKERHFPKEFKNWSEYFNDIHNVKYYQTPQYNEYSFFKVNLATNSNKINFIKNAQFMLDFSQAYSSASLDNAKFWIYPGDGFPSGSYTLKVRAQSASGSLYNPASGAAADTITGSYINAVGGPYYGPELKGRIHINLEITGSTSLATPITFDGGQLNLIKVFVTPIPTFITGSYISFTDHPSTASISSIGKPLDRAPSGAALSFAHAAFFPNFIEYTTADRLVFGPKCSYLSQQYDDNSSAPKVYADYLLHLRAVGPSEVDVEYTTIKPFQSCSFQIKCANGIEIESINEDLYYPALPAFTASLSASYFQDDIHDGKTFIHLRNNSGKYLAYNISGSGKLLRFRTNRQLFDYELLQSGRELITPPWGSSLDLIIPNIDKTVIFPTIENLVFHIDPSNEDWVRTRVSGSDNIALEIANPYGIPNLSQSYTASCPSWTNVASSFKDNIHYLNFKRSDPPQSLSSSFDADRLDMVNMQKFTLLTVFTPTSLTHVSGTIFHASSSVNQVKVETLGTGSNLNIEDIDQEFDFAGAGIDGYGGLRISTIGLDGGTAVKQTFNYAFPDTAVNTGHLLVLTSDGTDATTSGSLLRHNGAQQTSSYSSLDTSEDPQTSTKDNLMRYTLGGAGKIIPATGSDDDVRTNGYFIGHLGETILFNDTLPGNIIKIFEGYLAHKWGLEALLPSGHPYSGQAPDTSNTFINNSATEAALKKSQDYYVGSGSTSDRSSALSVARLIGIDDMSVTSGSVTFATANYNLLRELPRGINQTSSANDASIFVSSYDQKTGILELGYRSSKNVDGYWLQLGNSISGSVYSPSRVGIISIDKGRRPRPVRGWGTIGLSMARFFSGRRRKKRTFTFARSKTPEAVKKHWAQYIGYGPNEADIYNKDPRKVRALRQIAFGYASGRTKKLNTREMDQDNYRAEGSWYIPPTPAGESKLLANIKVDPKSFNGVPTITSWRLVTNDRRANFTGSWAGSTDGGGTVGFDDLAAVIKYAQQGFYTTTSGDSTIAKQAEYFDAEGGGGYIDIVDVLTIANHLVEASGAAKKVEQASIVPVDVCKNMDTAPGSLTVTATTKDSCFSGSAAKLTWVTSSGLASGYEIWRRGSVSSTNKQKKSSKFMFLGDREKLFDKTTQEFELIKVINTGSILSFVDAEAPYNEDCCKDSDNPKIEYVVIAFNKGGETAGKSNTIQLGCCNTTPVAYTSSITSSINTPITFTVDVTDNSVPPPFGTASIDSDAVKTLTFQITNYGNFGEFNELSNNNGMFTFTPTQNFLGKSNITYEVINSTGCRATSSVTLVYAPSKFTPKASVKMFFDNGCKNLEYGKVKLQWDRLDVKGKILKYVVHREASSSGDASNWENEIATISGKLPVSERFVVFNDRISAAGTYKYKVRTYGFQGNPDEAVSGRLYSTIDTDDVVVTISTRATASNPESVTVTTSSFNTHYHPSASFTWPTVGNSEVAQYYKVYRRIERASDQFIHIATVGDQPSATYTFADKTLPLPAPNQSWAKIDYNAEYRITAVSYEGENGDPNSSTCWSGENYPTYTVYIKGTSLKPSVDDVEFSFCNPGDVSPAGGIIPFTGDVSGLVSNNVQNPLTEATSSTATTFARTSDGVAGLTFSSDGTFKFSGSTNGTFTFDYAATSGGKTSDNGTVTLRVLNCQDLTCPPGEEAKHIICDAYNVHRQYSKTVDQLPFGLREKGGQIIRKSPKSYSVTRGDNPITGSW